MRRKDSCRKILIGNSYPFSLVRCARLVVESVSLSALQAALTGAEIVSFWGHANTRSAAEELLGVSLLSKTERPALSLSGDGRPMLEGEVFDSCWLLSPDYPEGFRPSIGAEVGLEMIKGWQVLKLTWGTPTAVGRGYENP